ncbi:unnamed protein product, partial [marine sediment metagenome]
MGLYPGDNGATSGWAGADFSVKFNPVTGRAAPVTFTWKKPSDEVTKYELWIAF